MKTGGQKRRLAAPLEIELHLQLADLLSVPNVLAHGWIWWHTPNGEYRNIATAKRLKAMGVLPGVSDILLVQPPVGRLYALELKRKGHHPSADQIAFMEAVRAAGGFADWADNLDDAVAILRTWGVVRVTT